MTIQTLPIPYAFDGAMLDQTAQVQLINALAQNGQSVAGGVVIAPSAAATVTLTGMGNLLEQLTNGGAVTVTFDSAYNIVNQLPQPAVIGEKFTFNIMTNAGTTVATPTLSDTAVTLAGTTTVLAAAMRWYQGVVTQLVSTVAALFTAGTTFTSLTQVGTTNNFTVALGTNTIVPVVGQLIYLNVSAGTVGTQLPSGWYPINKVTSATSFVIATPLGTVWTATAATLTPPAGTLQTPPAAGIYSPLVTITGLMATVTAVMSV